jgi:hypothetical protein
VSGGYTVPLPILTIINRLALLAGLILGHLYDLAGEHLVYIDHFSRRIEPLSLLPLLALASAGAKVLALEFRFFSGQNPVKNIVGEL